MKTVLNDVWGVERAGGGYAASLAFGCSFLSVGRLANSSLRAVRRRSVGHRRMECRKR